MSHTVAEMQAFASLSRIAKALERISLTLEKKASADDTLRADVQTMHDLAAAESEEYERAAYGRVLDLIDGAKP